MRIVITVEDSQPPAVGESASNQNHEDENAGLALNVATGAAAANQAPPRTADRALTDGAISAGPAAAPLATAEPLFLADTAVATDPAADNSEGSADLSAGRAPAII